ncbi:MAG: Tfp pilus assembly protein FimT/FimU [Thiohalorhabdus sp.]|uniref:Tfp pilus assembly protein FimT/FimU n=1 Tax=Thiohalorhabdus sp. TaxID=3094134 RepID=UPI00397EE9D8
MPTSAPGSCRRGDPCAAPGRQNGFTLLELLVVIALVAIITGLMVPSLNGGGGRSVVEAADRMVLLVNQVRQEAMLSSRTWRVVLDTEERSYRFQVREGQDFEKVEQSPFASVRQDPEIEWGALSINGEEANGEGEVYLYPTGEQDAFRLTLEREDTRRTVVLDPVGRARVEGPE